MKTKKNEELKLDALAFKEEMQRKVYDETNGMNRAEELAYYHKKAQTGPFSELFAQIRKGKKKLKRKVRGKEVS